MSGETGQTDQERWLTPGVGGVGAASFFSDTGHEITTAVLPSFLTATLHASAGALGLIEGISDALTGIMKLLGGPLANDPGRRARLASGGYLGTAIATGAIGLAATVWQAGALRALAWLSRGLRSPARDSLLAYAGFAPSWHAWPVLLGLFALAGSGIGLAETAESALVASMLPDRLAGSGFGLLGGVQSFGDFASSAAVGLLYAAVSPAAGFIYAAAWMALSAAASAVAVPAGQGARGWRRA